MSIPTKYGSGLAMAPDPPLLLAACGNTGESGRLAAPASTAGSMTRRLASADRRPRGPRSACRARAGAPRARSHLAADCPRAQQQGEREVAGVQPEVVVAEHVDLPRLARPAGAAVASSPATASASAPRRAARAVEARRRGAGRGRRSAGATGAIGRPLLVAPGERLRPSRGGRPAGARAPATPQARWAAPCSISTAATQGSPASGHSTAASGSRRRGSRPRAARTLAVRAARSEPDGPATRDREASAAKLRRLKHPGGRRAAGRRAESRQRERRSERRHRLRRRRRGGARAAPEGRRPPGRRGSARRSGRVRPCPARRSASAVRPSPPGAGRGDRCRPRPG